MRKLGATMILSLLVLLLIVPHVSAQSAEITEAASEAVTKVCKILNNIRFVLTAIAGGVGMLVIVLQGIKWAASADDPGARKQAKQGIIHAVVGLVIVVLAVWLVAIVISAQAGCATDNWVS